MANRETTETVTHLIFLGSKINVVGECIRVIKRCLLLQRKAMTNLDSILKSRDITLLTNVHMVKAVIFPVVMYGCERWIIKKAEHWRTDAFKLWCWRRFLRVPWTARRSNQSILKEINPECSLEGLMLKLWYFDHLKQRANSLEKILMLAKIEGRRRMRWQRMRWLDDNAYSMDMSLSKFGEIVRHREAWHAAIHEVAKSWTQLSNWITTYVYACTYVCVYIYIKLGIHQSCFSTQHRNLFLELSLKYVPMKNNLESSKFRNILSYAVLTDTV